MLYMAGGGRISASTAPSSPTRRSRTSSAHLKSQGVPDYLDAITDEDDRRAAASTPAPAALDESNDLYDQAVAVVLRDHKASTSYIQRRLSIGYNRAASLIERWSRRASSAPPTTPASARSWSARTPPERPCLVTNAALYLLAAGLRRFP